MEEPVVLRDLTNVLVHLAPSPVVARVPMTFTRARGRAWVEKELELVAALHDAGLRVACPVGDVPPGPYERDGFFVTLWEHVENDRDAELDAAAAGAALRRIHDALADVDPAGLEHFARLDEISSASPSRCRSTAASSRRSDAVSTRRWKVVDRLDVQLQPIHGDAHHGNVMRTPAGPLWGDFENVCLGPRELDLACNELRARAQGRDARRRRVPGGLRRPRRRARRAADPGARALPRGLDVRPRRAAPEVRPAAEERLGWVVDGFGL